MPDALKVMSENIQWTTQLGDAFLGQESQVMDAVQRLRVKAKDGGKLASSEQQKVETKVVEEKTVIEIQPASTEVVYVPTYSPSVIWGADVLSLSPDVLPAVLRRRLARIRCRDRDRHRHLGRLGLGLRLGREQQININNNNNYISHHNRQNNVNRTGNSNWQHNAQQRGGAPYKDRATANKYGGGARGDSVQARQAQASQRQSQNFDRSRSSGGAGREQLRPEPLFVRLGQLQPRRKLERGQPRFFVEQPELEQQELERFRRIVVQRKPCALVELPGQLEHGRDARGAAEGGGASRAERR